MRLLPSALAVALALAAIAAPCLLEPGLGPVEISRPVVTPAAQPGAEAPLTPQMLAFTENAGQIPDQRIRFHARGDFSFTGDSYIAHTGGGDVEFTFQDSNPCAPEGLDRAGWGTGYFMGRDPEGWHSGVSSYGRVLYRNLWDGIDLEFSFGVEGLKYRYTVCAFADPGQIKVRLSGHDGLALENGELAAYLDGGSVLRDSSPAAFYSDDAGGQLECGFAQLSQDSFTFEVPGRDGSRPIVIDPLVYSTYIGGAGGDSALAVASGPDGSAYVAGITDSPGIPPVGAGDTARESHDIFVAKLGPGGETLEYVAYLGGAQYDTARAIAADGSGRVYLTGMTQSDDFPLTASAADRTYGGVGDAFVARLGPDGQSLDYSTYLGGSHDEMGSGIAVDGMGQAYVTGQTWSADFPASLRAFGASLAGDCDAFVSKLSPQGDVILWSTFLGGSGSDSGTGIAVLGGYPYLVGTTGSSDFPATQGGLNVSRPGTNAFVAKLSPQGSALEYSALLGGGRADSGESLAVDSLGRAHVLGRTDSTDLPVTGGAFQPSLGGGTDLFVARLNHSGLGLDYCTYLGGAQDETAGGLAVDAGDNALVTGCTASAGFPTTAGGLDRALNGGLDAFISKVSADGKSLVYSSFLGGSGDDAGAAIASDRQSNAFIAGSTLSEDFPVAGAVPGKIPSGGADAFLLMADIIAPVAAAGPDIAVNESSIVRFDGSGSADNAGVVNWTWSFFDGAGFRNLSGRAPEHSFAVPGNYTVTLTVRDAGGNSDSDSLMLSVLVYPIPIAIAGPDRSVHAGNTTWLDGSSSRDNVAVTAYRWNFTDGLNRAILSADPALEWTFPVPGEYTAWLTVYDAEGNSNSTSVRVTVLDVTAPEPAISPVQAVREGSEALLDGSGSWDCAGVVNWTWTFTHNGTTVTLYGPEQSFRFWQTGMTEVTLTVADGSGNTASDVVQVVVEGRPEADALGPVTGAGIALLVISAIILAWAVLRGGKGGGA